MATLPDAFSVAPLATVGVCQVPTLSLRFTTGWLGSLLRWQQHAKPQTVTTTLGAGSLMYICIGGGFALGV